VKDLPAYAEVIIALTLLGLLVLAVTFTKVFP